MLRLEGLTVARSRTYTCPTGKKESLKDIAQDYKWSGPWFWQLSGLGNECSLGILRQWVPKCGLRRHQDCKRKGRKKKMKIIGPHSNLWNQTLWRPQRSILTSPRGYCDAHSLENNSSKVKYLLFQDIPSLPRTLPAPCRMDRILHCYPLCPLNIILIQ